ncbi:MAG: hypothetical protein ACOC8N_00005, partial [Spirochaetota bacterium]
MILLILFGLVFLVGVSLFAALVGTSLLKKNARVIRVPGSAGAGRTAPVRAVAEYAPPARQVYPGSAGAGERGAPPAGAEHEGPPRREERAAPPPREQRPAPPEPPREQPEDYGRRYRQEYQEELGGAREEAEARVGREAAGRQAGAEGGGPAAAAGPSAAAPTPFPLPPVSEGSRAGTAVWVLVTVLALALFAGALFITLRGWPSALTEPRLYFCEYVDFARQKPVNRSDTFTRGNVTLFVRSPRELDMNSATIEVYRLGEQQEPYAEKTVPLRPSWTSFAVQVLFEHTGSYRVSVLREDGTPLGIGRLS